MRSNWSGQVQASSVNRLEQTERHLRMTFRTVMALLVVAALTSGYASIRYPLPSCNGIARRQLNADQWSYDKRSELNDAASRKACG